MRTLSLFLCLLAANPLAASQVPCHRRVAVMGTFLHVTTWGASWEEACHAAELAIGAVEASERRLSTWRQDSELAQVNRDLAAGEITLSPATCRELALALAWAARTGGAFDPTVGPLVRLYDLRGSGRWPEPGELTATLRQVGHRHLQLSQCRLRTSRPGLQLEEGGFGKGAALDAALAAVAPLGVALRLELGGQVLSFGVPRLSLALAHPDRRQEAVAIWEVPPGSVATSGNSERGLRVGGRPLGHILDPRTGLPAPDFGSVAVWAPDGLTADALSTALFVLGPRAATPLLTQHPEIAAVFLVREGKRLRLQVTPQLRGSVRPLQPKIALDVLFGRERAEKQGRQR
ncbi:MAG: FAD:protein FMN transferase [Thermoanaerobaculum sp.]|nr:FAD:protein FMN transferase [Thermoanaerobaculum sp.]